MSTTIRRLRAVANCIRARDTEANTLEAKAQAIRGEIERLNDEINGLRALRYSLTERAAALRKCVVDPRGASTLYDHANLLDAEADELLEEEAAESGEDESMECAS